MKFRGFVFKSDGARALGVSVADASNPVRKCWRVCLLLVWWVVGCDVLVNRGN